MTQINLLPWRELKRERDKKQFMTYLVGALIVSAFIAFMINVYANHLVDLQNKRNQLLEKEITRLKKQIKEIEGLKKLRLALIARMNIVKNLQSTRSVTIRLFDELIKIMPDGVYLTKVERAENKITLFGYAESNTNISQLMRNIERNQWIREPELTEIKKSKESTNTVENEFKLNFIITPQFEGW